MQTKQKIRIKKVKPVKAASLDSFVTAISSITGFKHNCIKLKSGFAAVIQVPGIDIVNFKKYDQEIAYAAFGDAVKACKVSHKIVFMLKKPRYHSQIRHLHEKLKQANHPYRRHLLERQIEWLHYYEQNQTDRMAYVFFYADAPEDALKAAETYSRYLQVTKTIPHICNKREIIEALSIMLKGEEE